jgi:hypothetical protein
MLPSCPNFNTAEAEALEQLNTILNQSHLSLILTIEILHDLA